MTRFQVMPSVHAASNVLAIDPATRTAGWAVYLGGLLTASGFVRPQGLRGKEHRHERVLFIGRSIDAILREIPMPPDSLMAIEEPRAYTTGGTKGREESSMRGLWQMIGFLQAVADRRALAVRMVPIDHWRKTAGIRGGLERKICKEAAVAACRRLFGKQAQEDEADAILIGWHAVNASLPQDHGLPGPRGGRGK